MTQRKQKLTDTRDLYKIWRGFAAVGVGVIVAGLLCVFVAVVVGYRSADFGGLIVAKIVGTVVAVGVAIVAGLRFVDVEKFYNIFVWDRYYIGGAVVRPSTFNDWIRDGGDEAFAGEIYYNNVMIRGAKPENKRKEVAAKMRSAEMAKAAEGRNVADYWKRLAAKLAEADRSASDEEAKPATAKN